MEKWEYLRPWDHQVQTALAAGDRPGAWDALVRGYQHVVVGYCVTLLGDRLAGEDVAHDVFVDAYTALSRFKQEASIRTWVFAIARHKCMKHGSWGARLTRVLSRHRDQIVAEVHPDPPDSPEAAWLAAEAETEHATQEQQRLARWSEHLRRLSKRDRDLLMMRYVDDLTYRVIAQRLWVSETTARRRVDAAEQRLKRLRAADRGTP